ncbi:MAG TPA: ATP-binding cassette domain-containing protein [Xanthobacteraceae bacterium]|nr:ATP-binding cassette domain-containing protein [Xanthobacteraceae bacterium]
MSPPLLQLKEIALTFGGTPLLERAEFAVAEGDRTALVGRNGSGKSTLLRIAAGLIESDHGTRFLQPGTSIRYMPQEPDFSGFTTLGDYVRSGLSPLDDPHTAERLMQSLALTGGEDPKKISGGEARRAALACALAPDPDILLLDEPTNHLDLPTIEWLERELDARRSALVLISHDRRFLQNLTKKTIWLDRGETRTVEMGFKAFETWRDEQLAEEELNQHKLGRQIKREEHWIRYGVTARRKRNVRRVAELDALRKQKREYKSGSGKALMSAAEAAQSGERVIEVIKAAKSFGERAIVKDFSLRIMRGDRLGIVGPNGSGKTTLVNLLIGELPPDSGTVKLGSNLAMATLDQKRESLDPNWTLSDALTGGGGDTVVIGEEKRHVIGYMRDFLFSPEQARTPVTALSGGERGRLTLARALAKPSNVLVLDEPTNDLDLETLDVLEEMLASYNGTIILISHDRDFLDRVVNSVLVPEQDGRWTEYAGGYEDMLRQRGQDILQKDIVRKAEAPKAAPKQKAAAPERAPQKRKLSYNEKYALETLPAKMKALEDRVRELQTKLDDPELFSRDRKAFDNTTIALGKAQDDLAAAEEQWLALEIAREEIENG